MGNQPRFYNFFDRMKERKKGNSKKGILKMGGIVITLFIGLFVSLANGNPIFNNVVHEWGANCPTYAGQADFKLEDFMGHWYEIERYPNFWEKGRCQDAKYTLKDGGFDITNSEIRDGETTEHTMEGRHNPSSTDLADLQIWKWPWLKAQFLVVHSDYDSTMAVYSCYKAWFMRMEFAWIMSRERTLSDESLESVRTKLDGMGIKKAHFLKTDNNDCD